MKEEIERIKILLGINYFIHQRIFLKSERGYIRKDEALNVICRNHNIPKEECPTIIKSIEFLGLIKDEGDCWKVEKPDKDNEEIIFEIKKKLKMIN